MQLVGIGRVVFWEGGSLWLALSTGVNELHAHHAIQISLPLGGLAQFRRSQEAEWMSYAGAIITPDLLHAFVAPGRVVANILFEPESAAGRAILDRYDTPGIAALPSAMVAPLVSAISAAHLGEADDEQLIGLARRVIGEIAGVALWTKPTDRRVLRAIVHIREHIDEPIALGELAGAVGLSPGRFRHLFASETGVSCKTFVLWERLNRALALGFGGLSWTEAAHAANFADSAHLSRTCRRMFGFAPSSARIEHPASLRQVPA